MNEYKIMERDATGQVMSVAHVFATGIDHAMQQADFEQLHAATSVEIWHNKKRIALQLGGQWKLLVENFLTELGK